MKHWPLAMLGAAMLLVIAAGSRLGPQLPLWHEIVSALPSHADCHGLPISSVRPNWSLCVGGVRLPIMVTPYASGIATWPLALFSRDPFALRQVWMVIAALLLILSYRLIARVEDAATAGLCCLMVAASSPFLVINSLLLPFETLPCTLMVAALSAWSTVGDPAPRPLRLYAGALLAGLSVAANVKALFLLVPVMAIAWRAGVRLRGRVAPMLALFLLPALPMVIFAFCDPQHGFSSQVIRRSGYVLENLHLSRFASELHLLFNFAADTGSILDLAQGKPVGWTAAQVLVAVPIVYCMLAGVAHLVGRRWGSPLAAAAGAVVTALFLASILFYRQYPGGNYAPLHDLLGVAMAAGVVDIARRVAGRRWLAPALAAVAGLAALSLTLTLGRDFRRTVAISINAEALHALSQHLRANPDPPVVVTTSYNLAGIAGALGPVREESAYETFTACDRPDIDVCMAAAWQKLLRPPVRVLIPLSLARVDKPPEVMRRLEPTLTSFHVQLEARFSTGDGLPVLALYRLY